MIIKTSYLKTLIGEKVTLLDSKLIDFYKPNTLKPVGRIINTTDDGRLIVNWYTTHHNKYDINIFEDKFKINE